MDFNFNKPRKNRFRIILEWIITIAIALLFSLFIISNLVSLTQIKEESMKPTFNENDRVIIYKLGYFFKEAERGDVVILGQNIHERGIIDNIIHELKDIKNNIVYRFTGNIEKNVLIKRVVGVYGDIIDISDGHLYINGQEMEEGYSQGKTLASLNLIYPLEVPKDKVFVLGDNRENSLDSRDLGLIDVDSLKGKAVFRVFPFDSFGSIE